MSNNLTIDRRAIPAQARESLISAADGHGLRRIDFPAPASERSRRGSILFLGGRNDGYEKYLEAMAEWHAEGWRVTSVDWRGQGGSGRLGTNKKTGHISDFSVWVDDLAQFWADWGAEQGDYAAPMPRVVIGHSMGGHLALRAMAEQRIDPAAAVLVAPMQGFVNQPLPPAAMHLAARIMARLGDPARPAWKWSDKPGELPEGRIKLLTHDEARYSDEEWWINERPELDMGPGSWRWVERAIASMRRLRAPGVLERVSTPVLVLATRKDALVDFGAAEETASRLPRGELIAYGAEARHEILREEDTVRDAAMAAITEFLDRVAPPPAQRSAASA